MDEHLYAKIQSWSSPWGKNFVVFLSWRWLSPIMVTYASVVTSTQTRRVTPNVGVLTWHVTAISSSVFRSCRRTRILANWFLHITIVVGALVISNEWVNGNAIYVPMCALHFFLHHTCVFFCKVHDNDYWRKWGILWHRRELHLLPSGFEQMTGKAHFITQQLINKIPYQVPSPLSAFMSVILFFPGAYSIWHHLFQDCSLVGMAAMLSIGVRWMVASVLVLVEYQTLLILCCRWN